MPHKRKTSYSTWHEVWGKEYWKEYLGWKGIFGYWIEKLASKMPNKIIAVSDDTKYKLINQLKVNPNKIVVIPNGIDIKAIEKN
jgi:glycosyltransferase involved in cell wall biosynthesis